MGLISVNMAYCLDVLVKKDSFYALHQNQDKENKSLWRLHEQQEEWISICFRFW